MTPLTRRCRESFRDRRLALLARVQPKTKRGTRKENPRPFLCCYTSWLDPVFATWSSRSVAGVAGGALHHLAFTRMISSAAFLPLARVHPVEEGMKETRR